MRDSWRTAPKLLYFFLYFALLKRVLLNKSGVWMKIKKKSYLCLFRAKSFLMMRWTFQKSNVIFSFFCCVLCLCVCVCVLDGFVLNFCLARNFFEMETYKVQDCKMHLYKFSACEQILLLLV